MDRDSTVPRRSLVDRRTRRAVPSSPERGFSCKNNRRLPESGYVLSLYIVVRSIFVPLDTRSL